MDKSSVHKLTLLAAVTCAVSLLFIVFGVLQHDDGSRDVRFELSDLSGKSVNQSDFQGQFLLVFFGFTHCPDICPTQLAFMSQLMSNLDKIDNRQNIQPVFVSVDPQRDKPQVIKSYLKNFDHRFIGLTGSKLAIDQASSSFKAMLPRKGGKQTLQHSSMIYLVNPNSQVIDFIPNSYNPTNATELVLKGLNS